MKGYLPNLMNKLSEEEKLAISTKVRDIFNSKCKALGIDTFFLDKKYSILAIDMFIAGVEFISEESKK